MNKLIAFMALAVIPIAVGADNHPPKFSDKPIWVSGSRNCGGDGNARLLDVDQDGDPDVVTSASNPSRWVVFENSGGKLAETTM